MASRFHVCPSVRVNPYQDENKNQITKQNNHPKHGLGLGSKSVVPSKIHRDAPRKVLGELPVNVVRVKKDIEKQQSHSYVNDKPRGRKRIAPAENLEVRRKSSLKMLTSQNNTEPKEDENIPRNDFENANSHLLQPPNGYSVLPSLSVPVAAPLLEKSNPDISITGFSTYRFDKVLEVLPELPYKKEFLTIPEYLEEVHDYMLRREKKFLLGNDYLRGSHITPRMRNVLIDWLVVLGCRFNVLNDSLHIAVVLVDNFLSRNCTVTRNILQLIGVTALFIACKYEEVNPASIYEFADITDGSCSPENIKGMEDFILKTMKFHISPPSSAFFFKRAVKIAWNCATFNFEYTNLYYIGYFIIELAMVDYEACKFPPSVIGAAALALSMMINQVDIRLTQMWNKTLEVYIRYSVAQLRPALLSLSNIVARAYKDPKQLTSVKHKFSSRQYHNICATSLMCPKHWETSVLKQLYSYSN